MKITAIILVCCIVPTTLFAGARDTNSVKSSFLELAPIASYDMGKCVRLNAGINRNKHSWYAGIQSHINYIKDSGQPDNYITRKNGYAKTISDRLQINVGYQRNFRVNPNFEPFFFADITAGSVGLVGKVYGIAGTDSLGFHHYYTSISNSSFHLEDADFIQVSIGAGCRVSLSRAVSLTSRVGVGESWVSYTVTGLDAPQTTFDHFVISYSVGVQYNFRKR